MGKLSNTQIAEELQSKNYKLLDASNYTNLNSDIIIECPKNHKITTSLNTFRHISFSCPECDKSVIFKNPKVVPEKNGYRIIAFDQATENFGLSIFDNGQLSFYNLYVFTGDLVCRLTKIRQLVELIIDKWQPDIIIMEDIQCQNNAIVTYKILSMLLGILEQLCYEKKIKYEVVSPNVWRKYNGICGKNRADEKKIATKLVEDKYNIKVQNDIAEAILIGRYGVLTKKNQINWAF